MISDYDAPIGGIEQYLNDASKLLTIAKNEVSIVWLNLSTKILNQIRGYLLPCTAANFFFSFKLTYTIITQKPDLLRRHSTSRYIGWLPIWLAWLFHVRTRVMYHDLWYFHPYPSLLTSIDQIPSQRSLQCRITSGRQSGKNSIIDIIMMTLKFANISMIRRTLLRSVSLHLVPSPYMVIILEQWWIVSDKIQVLWHFGRIV